MMITRDILRYMGACKGFLDTIPQGWRRKLTPANIDDGSRSTILQYPQSAFFCTALSYIASVDNAGLAEADFWDAWESVFDVAWDREYPNKEEAFAMAYCVFITLFATYFDGDGKETFEKWKKLKQGENK